MMMGIWFILLVPFVIFMMVIGNQRRNEEEDEEVGSGTYHAEKVEEEEEQEEGNRNKTKGDPSPLWKYVTKQEETKGVELPNLFARIVKIFAHVHIPVGEDIYVDTCHVMKTKL